MTAKRLWPTQLDLSKYVRPGDTVAWSHAGAEPQSLVSQFLEQRHRLGGGVGVFLVGVTFSDAIRPEHTDVLRFRGIGGLAAPQALGRAGGLEPLPCRFSDLPLLIERGRLPIDVFFASATPPDDNGYVNLGVTVAITHDILAKARVAIVEINPHMPYVAGDTLVQLDRFDAAIWSDQPLIEGPAALPAPSAAAVRICENIAGLIGDDATVQIGIGATGTILPKMLASRRNLGIHSAIITDGLVALIESGAATGLKKEVDVGVAIAGEFIGTRALYKYADRNPAVALRNARYVLSQDVFSKFRRLFSVNSAIEVDLSGQVNAETRAGINIGAVGGQVDFVRAASRSPEGASIIALQATAGNGQSRIVSRLTDGIVTTARSEVGFVITEFGIADLRGATVPERARALARIAHPDHRESLERAAVTA